MLADFIDNNKTKLESKDIREIEVRYALLQTLIALLASTYSEHDKESYPSWPRKREPSHRPQKGLHRQYIELYISLRN